jgi:hypothetical protein
MTTQPTNTKLLPVDSMFPPENDDLEKLQKNMFDSAWRHPCRNYLLSISIPRMLKRKLGIKTPSALSLEEWSDYGDWLKKEHPYVWWFEEVLMDKVQDIFCYLPEKYRHARAYLRNRFIDKLHYLPTHLKKGKYYDVDTRMLHGLFATLVVFVEDELGRYHLAMCGDKPEYISFTLKQHGLAHLSWEMSLTDENKVQAEGATEVMVLYHWWTEVRPNRTDPHDEFADNECFKDAVCFLGKPDEHHAERMRIYAIIDEAEQKYKQEDDDMMIRLVKIRGRLWT